MKPTLRFVINLLFSSTIAFSLLLPIHKLNTYTVPLPPVTSQDTFVLQNAKAYHLSVGSLVPLYRYQDRHSTELGKAEVVKIESGQATFKIPRHLFLYPPGRQGIIVSQTGDRFFLDLGSNHGFKIHDELHVFKENRRVAVLSITNPDGDRTSAKLIEFLPIPETKEINLVGLIVSEYDVQTNVSIFSNYLLLILGESFTFLLVLVGEILLFRRHRLGIVAYLGRKIVLFYKNSGKDFRRLLRHSLVAILGIPCSFFFGAFLYSSFLLLSPLRAVGKILPSSSVWIFACVALAIYYAVFLLKHQFPLLWIWHSLAYNPRRRIHQIDRERLYAKSLKWFLHLFIAYAFAFALIDFLSADVNAMLDFLAPNHIHLPHQHASFSDPASLLHWFQQTLRNVQTVCRAGAAPLTMDQIFAVLRLLLWSITIVGCLVGYLHSTIKVLHWTSIRNVDFTILGWLTNAVCYGPLLGIVLWHIVPSPTGRTPAITGGPLFYAMLLLEFSFNVLYTASVWNMFTKFGVMVDKGLVDKGFFAIMRHPNYTLESFMFFLLSARGLTSFSTWVGVFFYFLIYWLRAEREEVFMGASNPDYDDYRIRVPWKYFPDLV